MHLSEACVAAVVELTVWYGVAAEEVPDETVAPVHDGEHASVGWESRPIRSDSWQLGRVGICAALANDVAFVAAIQQCPALLLQVHGQQLDLDAVQLFDTPPEGQYLGEFVLALQVHHLDLLQHLQLPLRLEIHVQHMQQDSAVLAPIVAEH